jgi:hypothetical protein
MKLEKARLQEFKKEVEAIKRIRKKLNSKEPCDILNYFLEPHVHALSIGIGLRSTIDVLFVVIVLNVFLCCGHGLIEGLRSDLENLRSKVSLPIDTNIIFEAKQGITEEIAETFCDPQGQTRIELGERYFAEHEENRLLIMLHEFIHVRHLTNSLSRWHHERIKYVTPLEQMFQEIWQSAPKEQLSRLDFWKQFLPHVFKHLYEIWAELCLKEKYPEMFPKRMELEHRNLRNIFDAQRGKYPNGYGPNAKYPIFVEMLRAAYFLKIVAEKTIIQKQFKLIHKGWTDELRKVVGEDEMKEFKNLEDALTDISVYPDPTILEERYFAFANNMVKNKR